MSKKIIRIFFFIKIVCLSFSMTAQDYILDMNLMLPPPYPVNFDAYVDKLEQGIVQVSNTSLQPVEAFFQVRFADDAGRLSVTTDKTLAQSITFPPGLTILSPSDINDIFSDLSESDFKTTGLSSEQRQAIFLNRQLPEGNYKLCLFAFNEMMEAISDPEGNGCFDFEITFPERPIIDQPVDGDVVDAIGNISLMWSHFLTDPEALSRTEYKLKLIDITEQNIENVQNAMLDPGIVADYEEELGATRFKFIQNDVELPLVKGHEYAARITAMDPQNQVAYQFGGHSEIITFKYGNESVNVETGILAAPSILNPIDGKDLIIGNNLPVKWEHEVEDGNGFNYTLKIIDRTATLTTATKVKIDDFEKDTYKYILEGPIVTKDTAFLPDSIVWGKDHVYSMVIKVNSSAEKDEFENGGYSKIVTFKYGKSEETVKAENCSQEFLAELPDDQTSVRLKSGKYKMGKIALNVTKGLTGDINNGFNGKGHVSLKLGGKNVKVKVTFENLKVNKKKEVIAGKATGKYDETTVQLDGIVASGASKYLDIDFDKAAAMTTYLRHRIKIGAVNANKPIPLPLGIDRDVAGETMVVGITGMKFTPEQASLTALFSIENPEWGKNIPTLGATNVCFTSEGLSDNVKLFLGKDYNIPLTDGDLKLKASDEDGQGEISGTFVKLDNKGFVEGQLTAELAIPRKILLPENEDGEIIEDTNSKAKLTLSGTFKSTKNFILSAKISACQIPGLQGFSFALENGFYDHSDKFNPAGINFPQGYGAEEAGNKWKGVWFSNAVIKAPKGWGFAGEEERTAISLKNFIKDKVGVSIKGEAVSVLSIDKGSLEGFAISIDKLSLDIIRGQFKSVKMEGKLGLPILPKEKYLTYEGIVDKPKPTENNNQTGNQKREPLSLSFAVKPNKDGYDIDWLKAHIDFDESSQFILKNDAKEKGFKASLSGVISIKNADENSDAIIEIPGLKFEGMVISKMTPKTADPNASSSTTSGTDNSKKPGSFTFIGPKFDLVGFGGSTSNAGQSNGNSNSSTSTAATNSTSKKEMNGFSISIDSIGLFASSGEIGVGSQLSLIVKTSIKLVGGKKKNNEKAGEGFAITAAGRFKINAIVGGGDPLGIPTIKDLRFNYQNIVLERIEVNAAVKGIKLEGIVEFYKNHPKFGNGMMGDLRVETPIITVDLAAKFGNKSDYNYWYVFGEVGKTGNEKPTLPLTTMGALQLWGFHGGAYYHMADNINGATAADRYSPDKNTILGLKAGVTLSVTKPEVLWAKVTLGLEFSNTGLNNLSMEGDAYMLKKDMVVNPLGSGKVDGIQAYLKAKINFKGDTPDFNATMDVYANVQNGLLTGAQDETTFKVVTSTMSINDEKWHFYIGKPTKPGKVKLKIPVIDYSVAASAYVMMGNEDMPGASLPKFISGILGIKNSGFSSSQMASSSKPTRENSGGFALGANIDYKLDINVSIIYARFRAMFGFDLSLLKNEGVVCSNNGGKPLGMDGWYAEGQLYAGLSGDIGLIIDLFFYEGRLSLASIQAAMLIRGGLPNPIWVNGRARMRYSVLGGLVEGSTGFNVQFGQPCVPQQTDPFSGTHFISAMSPKYNHKSVSVFVKPRVSFNSKIGDKEIYEVEVYDTLTKKRKTKKFKIYVHSFEFTNEKTKQKVTGKWTMESNTELVFRPRFMLSGKTRHSFSIVLKAKELMFNGTWVTYKKKDLTDWTAAESSTFTTGPRPDGIPLRNVAFMYPFYHEGGYLPDANYYKEGFLELEQTQNYLFEADNPSGQQWHSTIKAVFATPVKNPNYDPNSYSSIFTIDKTLGEMDLRTQGKFVVYKIPQNLPANKRIYMYIRRVFYENPNYEASGTQKDAINKGDYKLNIQGKEYKNFSSGKPRIKDLFFNHFKTSKYKTFKELVKTGTPRVNHYVEKGNRDAEIVYSLNINETIGSSFPYGKGHFDLTKESYPMLTAKIDFGSPYYKSLFEFLQAEEQHRSDYANDYLRPHGWPVEASKAFENVNYWNWKAFRAINHGDFYDIRFTYFSSREKSLVTKNSNPRVENLWKYNFYPPFDGKFNKGKYFTNNGVFLVAPNSGTYKLTVFHNVPRVKNGKRAYAFWKEDVYCKLVKSRYYHHYKN